MSVFAALSAKWPISMATSKYYCEEVEEEEEEEDKLTGSKADWYSKSCHNASEPSFINERH